MRMPRKVMLSTAAFAAGLVASSSFGDTSRYDGAQLDYEIGHYEQAFAEFANLADTGHCDAARIARQMVRFGRPLYGVEFKVASDRFQRWRRLPACAVVVGGTETVRLDQ